jgi:hypothetical protein
MFDNINDNINVDINLCTYIPIYLCENNMGLKEFWQLKMIVEVLSTTILITATVMPEIVPTEKSPPT